ncbi:hypothetical protein [Methylobacterium oxalidis]|uniref:hypothetical protein n=1 Tax=Methylobacterium oxalidis TaxID=944322 RepID=UPI0011BE5359|nr:hypothetical protein [Methylobacterium oxalidis]GJE34823.1 hypothetical protein LDDCCGHA_5038 [Methylobacterium oxalidis]
MSRIETPKMVSSGFRTRSESTLKTAIADGFGSVLVEIGHVPDWSGDIVGKKDQPCFRLSAETLGDISLQNTTFFFSGTASDIKMRRGESYLWQSRGTDGAEEEFLICPELLEKPAFDAANSDLFRRAAAMDLNAAADLVRVDKVGGLRRRAALCRYRHVAVANRKSVSVGILICCSSNDVFARATCASVGSLWYRFGNVASLWDVQSRSKRGFTQTATDERERIQSYSSVYAVEASFLADHDLILFLPAGSLVTRTFHALLTEIANHVKEGQLIQLRTSKNSRRLDVLPVLNGTIARPKDFPLTSFFPVIACASDVRWVLSGGRCYTSTLSLVFDLMRELDILEISTEPEDGLLQVAPPPQHLESLEIDHFIRNFVEATASVDEAKH